MSLTSTDTGTIRTRLNRRYKLWSEDRSDENLNALFTAIRTFAMRVLSIQNQDDREDTAQNLAITILGKLDSFVPEDDEAFARWISTVIKFVQMSHFKERTHSDLEDEAIEVFQHHGNQITADIDVDFNSLPPDIKFYAEKTIEGYEPHEIATLLGYSGQRALNNRIAEYRKTGKAKSIQRLKSIQ